MTGIRKLLVSAALVMSAVSCRSGFDFAAYTSDDALFTASLQALNSGKSDFAAAGFENLTLRLGTRDTLLPLSHFYLGQAQSAEKNHLQAAQSFARVHALFPNDSLADDALLHASRAYRRLWKNVELDKTYGEAAKQTLQTILESYPTSPLTGEVFAELAELDDLFARKELATARQYLRFGSFSGVITYAQLVVDRYPTTPTALEARVLLVRAYRELKWDDNVAEECGTMRALYPGHARVRDVCGVQSVDSSPR